MVGVLVLMALASLSLAETAKPAAAQAFQGYLIDVYCTEQQHALDGSDVWKEPQKHTVACLKMPICEQSGYGIMSKAKTGKYVFTKFDAKGNELAKEYIAGLKIKDNVLVQVAGTKEKDMIKVTGISNVK